MPAGTTGYLFGIFDLFHIAHLDTIRLAADRCDRLVVAVATDELVSETSNLRPFVPYIERVEIVSAIRAIGQTRPLNTLDLATETASAGASLLFLPTVDLDVVQSAPELTETLARSGIQVSYLPLPRQTESTAVRNALNDTTHRSSVA